MQLLNQSNVPIAHMDLLCWQQANASFVVQILKPEDVKYVVPVGNATCAMQDLQRMTRVCAQQTILLKVPLLGHTSVQISGLAAS